MVRDVDRVHPVSIQTAQRVLHADDKVEERPTPFFILALPLHIHVLCLDVIMRVSPTSKQMTIVKDMNEHRLAACCRKAALFWSLIALPSQVGGIIFFLKSLASGKKFTLIVQVQYTCMEARRSTSRRACAKRLSMNRSRFLRIGSLSLHTVMTRARAR
jgi:hypothetical protein